MARLCTVLCLISALMSVPSMVVAASPLSPVVGVFPEALDFASVHPGAHLDLIIDLRNDVSDPSSVMHVSELGTTDPLFRN